MIVAPSSSASTRCSVSADGQRLEQERRRVRLAAAPAGAEVEELGSRHREQEQRDAVDPLGEVVDEVEQRRFRPLQVVEDDDDRTVERELLEEASDRPEQLLDRRRLGGDPERLGQLGEDRLGIVDAGEAIAQPVEDVGRLGLLVEPDRGAQELRDRVPGDALAVRQAAAAQDLGVRARPGEELVDEPALADAGRAEDGDEDAAFLDDGPLEGGAQDARARGRGRSSGRRRGGGSPRRPGRRRRGVGR